MNTSQFLLSTLLLLLSTNTIAQQFMERTLIQDGNTRAYTLYVPASHNANSPSPLLFNFHGGSGTSSSQIAISDMRPIADTTGLILVYPQAFPDPNDGGSTNWTHKPPATIDDIFFVEAMIDELAAEYNIDQSRVYACGYSNGGEFSFELACRLSHRIAAIGVVARSMFIDTYNACSPTHPTAVVTIHGTADEYEGITFGGITYYISLDEVNSYWSDYNNTDPSPTIVELPNTNGSDGSTVEHYTWSNGDGCVAVEHYKVISGGHDWPGTFGNMDINSDVAIWNFVSKYNLNGLIDCTTTSIDENIQASEEMLIYPNPVTNRIIIETEINDQQTYHIYSTVGQHLLSGTLRSNRKVVDVSALPPNLYLLKVGNQTWKFLKME